MRELKELPAEWRWVKLEDVCSFRHGGTPSKSNKDFWHGDIPWVSPKDMGLENTDDAKDRISTLAIESSNTSLVPEGTILAVVRSGILARRFPVAIARSPVAFNQDIKAILPKIDTLDSQFLRFTLKVQERHILEQGVKIGATVHSIRSGFIEKLKIPLPPLSEQRRIAAILTEQLAAVEQARKASEARLEAACALPAAYLREVFESEEARKWKQIFLANLIEEFRYGTSNKSASKGYTTLRIPNVIGNTLDLNDLKNVPLEDQELEKLKLINGDLLFVRTNGSPQNVGRSAVFDSSIFIKKGIDPTNIIFASYLIRARLKCELILPSFLQSYLQTISGREAILSKCKTTAGQYNINTQGLGELPIPLPSINIQNRTIDHLEKRLSSIKSLENSIAIEIEYINFLPATVLAQAFSGAI